MYQRYESGGSLVFRHYLKRLARDPVYSQTEPSKTDAEKPESSAAPGLSEEKITEDKVVLEWEKRPHQLKISHDSQQRTPKPAGLTSMSFE